MTREDLIDEMWFAIWDAHDVDSNTRTLAKAAVARLEKLGIVTLTDEPEDKIEPDQEYEYEDRYDYFDRSYEKGDVE